MKNTIRFVPVLLATWLFSIQMAVAAVSTDLADSLRRELDATDHPKQRTALLINMMDLSMEGDSNEQPYCFQLFDLAYDARDGFALTAALSSIVIYNIERQEPESVTMHYLDDAERMLAGSRYDGVATYYKMALRARELQNAPRAERAEICRRLLAFYEARREQENVYEQAERLFMSGVIAYQLLPPGSSGSITAGLPYWEEMQQLISRFHQPAHRLFAGNLIGCLLLAYSSQGDAEKLISVSDAYLAMLDAYFDDAEVQARRPYISRYTAYMVCYQALIDGGHLIGSRRADEYYRRYCKFRSIVDDGDDPLLHEDIFFFALSVRHHTNMGDYQTALAYSDSLTTVLKSQGSTSTYISHYHNKAKLLGMLGRFEQATEIYEQLIHLSDSLSEQRHVDMVSEMEARFGVEKLQTSMVAERRRYGILLMIGILVLTAGVGLYLYRNLRREKRLRAALKHHYDRAEESERLKSTFLNMMGHEVRTPLNVIGGFAEVLATGGIPQEQQGEYLHLMLEHAQLLTSLVNDMLEVSNLDSSTMELTYEQVCVNEVFRNLVDQMNIADKESVVLCQLEIPDEELVICTHQGYFVRIFRELLKNARKFAPQGTITFSCRPDHAAGQLICMVTDSGTGIPADQAEYIFERFTKLDPFAQGTGIGLHLCRLIASKLQGAIYLDTTYTSGARFVVTLPLK